MITSYFAKTQDFPRAASPSDLPFKKTDVMIYILFMYIFSPLPMLYVFVQVWTRLEQG